jgi:hypothetical protein
MQKFYCLIAATVTCSMFAMERIQSDRKATPTEYALAMYTLKKTPPAKIPNLILKRMPEYIRTCVFDTL